MWHKTFDSENIWLCIQSTTHSFSLQYLSLNFFLKDYLSDNS